MDHSNESPAPPAEGLNESGPDPRAQAQSADAQGATRRAGEAPVVELGIEERPEHLPQIRRLNHRHEGVLRWLLANPNRPLGDCAKELGYTPAWLSTVIHSQAFQAELRTRQILLYGEASLEIRDKLVGAAHLALDKIIESIPVQPPQFALDASKEVLKSLGYTAPRHNQPPHQTNIQVNVGGGVSPEELQQARQAMMAARQSPTPAPAPMLEDQSCAEDSG
jgi:hypothetical protein